MKLSGFGTKKNFARLCSMMNLDQLILYGMKFGGGTIRIVTYHRVLDRFDPETYPFDEELIDATTKEFRTQLRYLSENYDVISFNELIECVNDNRKLPNKTVLITFDDGFRDNYDHAFPIILEYSLPVTMLLATDYIGAKNTFWYDKLAFILFNTTAQEMNLKESGLHYNLRCMKQERRAVFRKILKYLSRVDDDTRLATLDEIDGIYGDIYDNLSPEIKALSQPLTWEQVKEMHAAGVAIGSHTKSHSFLSRLNNVQLQEELVGSKKKIEGETGAIVSVIAYPNGQKKDFNERVKAAAKEAGYSLGLSYINGVNKLKELDCYALKRLHVSPSHDNSVFKMALSLPLIF